VHRIPGWEPGAMADRIASPFSGFFDGDRPSLADRVYWRMHDFFSRFVDEIESLWCGPAIRAGWRIIEKHRIDVVVCTSPPYSVQSVGRALQERTGATWVADLRDPILDNFAKECDGGQTQSLPARMERMIAQHADHIVVTCPEVAGRLAERYPS